MRQLARWVGTAIILTVLVAAFLAYFVISFDPESGRVFDGLGREVFEAPALVRILVLGQPQWPGLLWMLADYVWFFGGLTGGWWLLSYGLRVRA